MKSRFSKILAALSLVAISAALLVTVTGCTVSQPPAAAAANETAAGEAAITGIYAAANPTVVQIIVKTQRSGFGGYSSEGQGSGFVIDKDGHILTNNHVVEGATSVDVVFSDGNTVIAEVLGTDSLDDLAVIKVDAAAVADITPLTMVDTSNLLPGQLAIALGSPYGLANSISVGVVSGLNRSVEGSTLTGLIQTDANIQPGNSGGPLLNSSGQVIGINTATEGTGTGIGYAVPASTALRVLDDLKASKKIERPWLGISGTAVTKSLAEELALSVDEGVYVAEVVSDSPAQQAGLIGATKTRNNTTGKGGDIITAIDGKNVASITDLQSYLFTKNVGDEVTLTVLRDGTNISVKVKLEAYPTETTSTTPESPGTPDFPWPWGDD